MTENKNIEIVKRLFEFFGNGDIPSAMDLFADEVHFQSPVTRSRHKNISWSNIRRNQREIGSFFQELNEKVSLEKMFVSSFTAQNDKVVVEGRNQGTVISTGKDYEHDWVMVFDLKDGKIIRNLHYYDTADIESAF